MTKRSRIALFFTCLFLFTLSAAAVVFYYQGYRFDFTKRKITQTGAFYFKVSPNNVQIYLDGQLKKKTVFFFDSALVENLLPKTFKVQVKKNGYLSWEKTLEIKEKQVTEVKNIVLFPEEVDFETLAGNVNDFFFAPDGKKIILQEINKDNWQLALYEIKSKERHYLIGKPELSQKKADFYDFKFSPDSKRILLGINFEKEGKKYFILNLENFPPDLIPLNFLGEGIQNFYFDPQNSQKIFFTKLSKKEVIKQTQSSPSAAIQQLPNLFIADWKTQEISQPILNNVIAYTISDGNIFWISSDGFLLMSDLSGKKQEKLSPPPFSAAKGDDFQLLVNFPKILIKKGGDIYFFDQNSSFFKKISSQANNFSNSPDFKKVFYSNNYEIWVLFLEENYDQPQKKMGEESFLTRFSEKTKDYFWLTDYYLIFDTGNKIKIAEIDDRDRINIIDLPVAKIGQELENPKIFWNQAEGKVYILNKEILYSSEKLTP